MNAWTKQPLNKYVTFKTGKLNSNAAVENGMYPFFTCAQEIYKTNTWSFDTECVLLGGNNASAIYPIFYYNGKFDAYQRTYVIEPKSNNSIRFFYYAIRKKLGDLKQQSTGATTRFLTIGILNNLQIESPEPSDQLRISSMLSTYDDLIENNKKRIKVLEEMAQKLFVEWFEKLKFPGYEKTVMIDSELGQIPEGWKVSKLSGISDIISGYPFKSSTYKKIGKYKIVTIKNVQAGEFVLNFDSFLEDLPANLPVDCVLEQGDILLSLTGNVGRICTVLGEDHVLNQRVAKIKPKNGEAREYVYYMFSADQFRKKMEAFSNGAAQQNLSPVQLANFKILIPEEKVLANFHNIVSNYFNLSLNLKEQNQALSKMRDLLIPQLITGRKEIKN